MNRINGNRNRSEEAQNYLKEAEKGFERKRENFKKIIRVSEERVAFI